jgi:hypothetical protein
VEGVPFDVATLHEAAKRLDAAAFEATRYARECAFSVSFEDAMRVVMRRPPSTSAAISSPSGRCSPSRS